jgi:hypothetical protein
MLFIPRIPHSVFLRSIDAMRPVASRKKADAGSGNVRREKGKEKNVKM